ncbi:MAG: DUF2284 domain-containing protein [Clostridia bacterium]|nr:DUF2284 domain-containing protein [Clostridia bacterium]
MFENLMAAAKELGASNVSVIAADKIETDTRFRDMCAANSCGMYGKCWMCPPDVGEINALMAELKTYSHALVYQYIGQLEDSYDFEGMIEARHAMSRLSHTFEKHLSANVPVKYLHLSVGGCGACEVCAKQEDKPCVHPELALASLEAYGVNVSRLAAVSDMKYINGANTVTYFGAVLFTL